MVQSCVLRLFIKKEYGHWGLPAKASKHAASAFALLRTRQALPFGPDSQARASYDARCLLHTYCVQPPACPVAKRRSTYCSRQAPSPPVSPALPSQRNPICTSHKSLTPQGIPPASPPSRCPAATYPSLPARQQGPFLPSPPTAAPSNNPLPLLSSSCCPLKGSPLPPPPSCCPVAPYPLPFNMAPSSPLSPSCCPLKRPPLHPSPTCCPLT